MKVASQTIIRGFGIRGFLIDIFALLFIYLIPAASHLFSLPLYLIDPMRLMIFVALVHSNKTNSYLLAISLPLFSLMISGHPVFAKMILIMIELGLNVFFFYALMKRIKFPSLAVFLSILISKSIYYLLKFFLIKITFLDSSLVSTPLFIQLIVAGALSTYFALFYLRSTTNSREKSGNAKAKEQVGQR